MDKTIYIGADHAGFELKEKIKEYLTGNDMAFEDMGNTVLDKNDDYPDFALAVSEKVKLNDALGILVCHNGVGMSIVANKLAGIRAVNTDSVKIAQEAHNDDHTNILCLPGGYIDLEKAIEIITGWLSTEYGVDERYQRRVDKVEVIENK